MFTIEKYGDGYVAFVEVLGRRMFFGTDLHRSWKLTPEKSYWSSKNYLIDCLKTFSLTSVDDAFKWRKALQDEEWWKAIDHDGLIVDERRVSKLVLLEDYAVYKFYNDPPNMDPRVIRKDNYKRVEVLEEPE